MYRKVGLFRKRWVNKQRRESAKLNAWEGNVLQKMSLKMESHVIVDFKSPDNQMSLHKDP